MIIVMSVEERNALSYCRKGVGVSHLGFENGPRTYYAKKDFSRSLYSNVIQIMSLSEFFQFIDSINFFALTLQQI